MTSRYRRHSRTHGNARSRSESIGDDAARHQLVPARLRQRRSARRRSRTRDRESRRRAGRRGYASVRLKIRTIALTHGHPDHASGAAPLVAATGASVYAHPKSKIARDADLPLEGELRVGEIVAAHDRRARTHLRSRDLLPGARACALYRRHDPRRRNDGRRAARRRNATVSAHAATTRRRVRRRCGHLRRTRTRRYRPARENRRVHRAPADARRADSRSASRAGDDDSGSRPAHLLPGTASALARDGAPDSRASHCA